MFIYLFWGKVSLVNPPLIGARHLVYEIGELKAPSSEFCCMKEAIDMDVLAGCFIYFCVCIFGFIDFHFSTFSNKKKKQKYHKNNKNNN